jgi:hypothetical protein
MRDDEGRSSLKDEGRSSWKAASGASFDWWQHNFDASTPDGERVSQNRLSGPFAVLSGSVDASTVPPDSRHYCAESIERVFLITRFLKRQPRAVFTRSSEYATELRNAGGIAVKSRELR